MTYKIHYSIYAAVFTCNKRTNITHTKQNIITYCCKYEIFLLFYPNAAAAAACWPNSTRCFLFFMSLVVARSIRHLADVFAASAALSLYLRLAFVYVFHSLSMYVSFFSVHVHMYASSVCVCVCTFTWPTRTHKLPTACTSAARLL